MNNNINAGFSEIHVLQCTSQERDIILPFVDKLCNDLLQNETPEDSNGIVAKPKQTVPKLYRNTGMVTILLCGLGFILMFADAIWSFIGLNSPVYIIWCLCCLSLFYTNKIALAEWKSINE